MAAKKRMDKEQWDVIRDRWETDPRPGYVWIVSEMSLEVSSIAVLQKAKREGWAKKASIKSIVQRAHIQADLKGKAKLSQSSPNVSVNVSEQANVSVNVSALTFTEADSVDLRSDVLERHRAEWRDHGDKFKLSDMVGTDGLMVARTGKTAAEMVKIRQEGERKAWSLDTIAEDTTGGQKTMEELDKIFADGMKRSDEMRDAMRKERREFAERQAHAAD